MEMVTCSSCGGSGKARRGQMVPGVDWTYPFFANSLGYQRSPERQAELIEFLKTIKPGDTVTSSGQFEHVVVEVGMYDGWPYWKPTPAISYYGPLGSIEYDFYNNLSAPWRANESQPVVAVEGI